MSKKVFYLPCRSSVAGALYKHGVVSVNLSTGFPYTSGGRGPVYYSCSLLQSLQVQSLKTLRRLIVTEFSSHIQEYVIRGECDAIAGVQTAGANPISVLVARSLQLPHFGVWKDSKDGSWIDGPSPEGKNVLLVKDVWSSGDSARKALEHLTAEGAVVVGCGVVLTYPTNPDPEPFENLFALSSFDDFKERFLLSNKKLSRQDVDRLFEWRDNPTTWVPTSPTLNEC